MSQANVKGIPMAYNARSDRLDAAACGVDGPAHYCAGHDMFRPCAWCASDAEAFDAAVRADRSAAAERARGEDPHSDEHAGCDPDGCRFYCVDDDGPMESTPYTGSAAYVFDN
jgi:hypothetical protein